MIKDGFIIFQPLMQTSLDTTAQLAAMKRKYKLMKKEEIVAACKGFNLPITGSKKTYWKSYEL